jgi:hypothetical protein
MGGCKTNPYSRDNRLHSLPQTGSADAKSAASGDEEIPF